MIALTPGQRFVVVILLAIAVIVLVVWPSVRPARRDGQTRTEHQRLMEELNRDRHR